MNANTKDTRGDAVLSRLIEHWFALHRGQPELLYHYTNATGLFGMLTSNKIWATNSRFLNDPTEIEYAIRLVRNVTDGELGRYGLPQVRRLQKSINEILDGFEREARVHLACFCAEGDLLSQWRGYGAVGGGYAVGIESKYLGVEVLNPNLPDPKPILRKVIYSPHVQTAIIRDWARALARLARAARTHSKTGSAVERFRMFEWYFERFLSECLNCFKDPAYTAEQEWRLIQFGAWGGRDIGKAEFRTSGSRVVPYVELDVTPRDGPYKGKLPVKIIRFGPTLDPRVTGRSLQLFCTARGYAVHYDDNPLSIKRRGAPGLVIMRSGVPLTG